MPVVVRPRYSHRPSHRPLRRLARALGAAVLAAGLLVAPAPPLPAGSPALAHPHPDPALPPPPGLRAFMQALAAVESGGRYTARNASSGAYGRYQILPSNWPAWAARYLGDRDARPTPRNQERVAAGRLTDLYRRHGDWGRVAHWWLTGDGGPRSGWSAFSTRYVDRVLRGYRTRLASPPAGGRRILPETSPALRFTGTWRTAAHPQYAGGEVRYASEAGATMVVRFTGRAVRIEGPTGPTRGRVRIEVDGRVVRTVDLRAARFHPRRVLVSQAWAAPGTHRVVLRVLGTRGRPVVAVDRVIVRG